MAIPILYDSLWETSTTTGTGNYTLAGAKKGYRPFADVLSNNVTIYYAAHDSSHGGWEVGLGTWLTGGILVRTQILAGSNGTNPVNWSAGIRDIVGNIPAAVLNSLTATSHTGAITGYAGNVAPPGALLCDGSLYNVADHPELFALIGYSYGGSGIQFAVPNLTGFVVLT